MRDGNGSAIDKSSKRTGKINKEFRRECFPDHAANGGDAYLERLHGYHDLTTKAQRPREITVFFSVPSRPCGSFWLPKKMLIESRGRAWTRSRKIIRPAHFRMLALDGVDVSDERGELKFRPVGPHGDVEVARVTAMICRLVLKLLKRR